MLNQAERERKDRTFWEKMNKSLNKVEEKKMAIIANFPIPTTKDDILEFLALAVPKAQKAGNVIGNELMKGFGMGIGNANEIHNVFVPVWKAKCEQIIIKARFSLKDDREVLEKINSYAKEIGMR